MEEYYSKSLARSIENLHNVTWSLIYNFTINILFDAFVYFDTAKHSSLITMQDIVHIATRKCIHRLANEIWFHSHCRLNVGFHQIYAECVT